MGRWALETRLEGSRPSAASGGAVGKDCVEFLVQLFSYPQRIGRPAELHRGAEIVARVCPPELVHVFRTLGQELERQLAALPRGRVHGDFWRGNLLVDDNRLTGVLDWSAARDDGLPLMDLAHLLVSEARERTNEPLGAAVVRVLLEPGRRRDWGPLVDEYVRRLGWVPSAEALQGLGLAYWLDRLARLVEDPDPTALPVGAPAWVAECVVPVLREARYPYRFDRCPNLPDLR